MNRHELATLRRARRRENVGGIISNEIILYELAQFLGTAFPSRGEAVLDLGAGTSPYAPLYRPYFDRSVSVDVEYSIHDTTNIDVTAPADELPFDPASFDCVICTEVLEHCPDPWAAAAELARVLKPGGWAFLTTPFLRPLHEGPHDYHRFTPWGLAELARRSGLEIRTILPRGDYTAVTLMTLLLPISKLWQHLPRVAGFDLGRVASPFVWLSIVVPQRLYVAAWRVLRHRPDRPLRKIYDKLTYYTLGYITVAQLPR
jgi:SAM-dependent methyltransferase